jgi:DMSO/TMAO reductase YedYZ molybdopterin-dependent catalytic subunit
MRKRLFQIAFLAITFWLIWPSSLTQVLGTDTSDVHQNTFTANSESILFVDGGVQRPINLTVDELAAMPKNTVPAELICPGFFTINGNWTGVRLSLVLEKAGFDPNATTVNFLAQDGYEVSLSIRDAMRDDVIIAYEKDGEPLPEKTRLVIPGTVGGQWISNITQIALPTSTGGFSIVAPTAIIVIAVVTPKLYMIGKRKRSHDTDSAREYESKKVGV